MKYSPLNIVIEYKKEIDVFENFIINATASTDPDDPNPSDPQLPFGPFVFKWDCAPWDELRGNYFSLRSCFVVRTGSQSCPCASLLLPSLPAVPLGSARNPQLKGRLTVFRDIGLCVYAGGFRIPHQQRQVHLHPSRPAPPWPIPVLRDHREGPADRR